jgi:hypothetical protein
LGPQRARRAPLSKAKDGLKDKKAGLSHLGVEMNESHQTREDSDSPELPKITTKDKIWVAVAVGLFLTVFIIIVLFGSFGLF